VAPLLRADRPTIASSNGGTFPLPARPPAGEVLTSSRQFVEAQLMSHASTILPGDTCGINQDSAFNSNACRDCIAAFSRQRPVWSDNLDENGAAIRMRSGGRGVSWSRRTRTEASPL
jgi:hypothetical protein